LSALGVKYLQSKLFEGKDVAYKKVNSKISLCLVGGLVIVFLLAILLNFPTRLSKTEPDVLMAKAEARKICRAALDAGDYVKAENTIRSSAASREAAANFEQNVRISMDRILQRISAPILTFTGTAASIAPFVILLILTHNGVPDYLRQFAGSPHYWIVVLPVVNVVTAVTCLTFGMFYFWIDTNRSDICLKTSGHWYYYVMTTLCYAWALSHFILTDGWSNLTRWYAGYTVVYQAIMLRILSTTQRFYHDPDEAKYAIKLAICLIPCAVAAGFLVLGSTGLTPLDFGKGENKSTEQSEEKEKEKEKAKEKEKEKDKEKNDNKRNQKKDDTIDNPPPPSLEKTSSGTTSPPMDDSAPPPPLDDVPTPPSASSGGLFDDIKKGVKLKPKPVVTEPKPVKPTNSQPAPTDLMAAMQAKLRERRKQLDQDTWDTE